MHISKDAGVSLVLQIDNTLPLVENADLEATEEACLRMASGSAALASVPSSVPSVESTFAGSKRKSKDIGWEYGVIPNTSNPDRIKCTLCGEIDQWEEGLQDRKTYTQIAGQTYVMGIGALPRFKKILDQAKKLTIFIISPQKLAMMREFTKKKKMKGRLDTVLHLMAYLLNPYYFYKDTEIQHDPDVSDAVLAFFEIILAGDLDMQLEVTNLDVAKVQETNG
ncbi:hypothetical protein Tco_0957192 [Tanacetum coccineum]